ncbi:MAG: thioredoxin family protein [Verrucomicrobia bacterium]|jgi:hypothetical protein|nr:thioredoxin family protein [Verrucomicrobiota bacterium]NBS04848.1 thioredoxin family protein [Verrucomicrobiota bacterium]NBY36564.1 thioredoxin family protein [Verrucomicrobiota bacterium]
MRIASTLLACFAAIAVFAAAEIGQPAPAFTAKTADGKTVSLSDYKGKIVVLEWYNPGCPVVRKFYDAGKMQEFQKQVVADGGVWLAINTGGKVPDLGKNVYYPATALIDDADGAVARAYEAKVTPHCYVIDAKGNLAYKGAIDSGSVSTKVADLDKSTNYVLAAIKAIKAGNAPEVTNTKPYGCGVKYDKN